MQEQNMNTTGSLVICGGCNAKIGAGHLSELLKDLKRKDDPNLLVGFESSDDAAVIKMTDDLAIIQTLDFFPTMVNDPYLFGKIAAANALSDVYAMGGDVLSALNIVCFPEQLDIKILGEILRGGADKIFEAGGVLCGGHSIHDSSVKYGLSVTGTIHPDKILANDACKEGDVLILTKPLGVSIITTAYSVGEVGEEAFEIATNNMQTLNKYAAEIMKKYPVNSCTDVTGFGLAGHLHEMVHGELTAVIDSRKLPYIQEAYNCANEFLLTAGGQRNRNHMQEKMEFQVNDFAIEELLFDPQTSGGLLISIPKEYADDLMAELSTLPTKPACFGEIIAKQDKEIIVI